MAEEKTLVTAEWVARRMGVSTQKVWKMTRERQIPCTKISQRVYRYDPDDIELWLDRRTTPGRRVAI